MAWLAIGDRKVWPQPASSMRVERESCSNLLLFLCASSLHLPYAVFSLCVLLFYLWGGCLSEYPCMACAHYSGYQRIVS